jgi:hypothetical protein
MTMLSLGMSVLGQGVSLMGQMAQSQAQDAYYEQNRQNALQAFSDKQNAFNIREQQEQTSAAAQTFDNSLKTRAAEATASTAAGESGVGGLSIEGLMQDFSARGARANDRIAQQGEWTQAQLESEKTAAGDQAVSQINSVQPGQFGILNFADAAVRIGGSAVSAMTSYQKSQINSVSG